MMHENTTLITLTRENLHALCGSPNGEGFTRKQLDMLGVAWPAKKGWLSALRGKQITQTRYDEIKAACSPKWKQAIGVPIWLPLLPDARAVAFDKLRIHFEIVAIKEPKHARILWEKVLMLAESAGLPISDEQHGLFL